MARYAVFSTCAESWDYNHAGYIGSCDVNKWREFVDANRAGDKSAGDAFQYEGGNNVETEEHIEEMEISIWSDKPYVKAFFIGNTMCDADMYFFVPIDEE